MRMRIVFIICAILLSEFPLILGANVKKKNFFTVQGIGARGMVLKASLVSSGGNYFAGQLNPAGIGFSREVLFAFSRSELSLNRELAFMSAVIPIEQNQHLGFFYRALKINKIEARTDNTSDPDYYFTSAEQQIGISFARSLMRKLSMGIAFNFVHASLSNHYGTGWGLDFGIIYKISENFALGASINDYHQKLTWETGHADYYEKVGNVGVSYRLTRGTVASFAYQSKHTFSTAMEVQVSSPLALRMGWSKQQLAIGAGIKQQWKDFSLQMNYSLASHGISNEISQIFDISLGFKRDYRSNVPHAMIKISRLNVRSGPGLKFRVIATVRKWARYEVLDEYNGWVKIRYRKNKHGWVLKKYVKITDSGQF